MIIIFLAIIVFLGLLFYEKRNHLKGKLITKPVVSMLFIVTALVQTHLHIRYTVLIVAGLVFCFIGDVFLVFTKKRLFLLGLVSFLLGHILYIIAFHHVLNILNWPSLYALIIIIFSLVIYLALNPSLGEMRPPVVVYIVIISIMLIGALALVRDDRVPEYGRIMVFTGAACFYASDLFVAVDRFIKNHFINRLVGLPLYYLGQYCIAFSVGYVT